MIPHNLIFETSKGSLYFQREDGTWLRKKHDGENIRSVIYLGSINPDKNKVYLPHRLTFSTDLDQEVLSGVISGFSPSFSEGNHPFGIKCDSNNPASFEESSGRIILPKKSISEKIFGRKLDYHVGDLITVEY